MPHIAPETPVIIFAGQLTQRWQEGKMPLEPLRMVAHILQTQGGAPFLPHIDGVFISHIFGYPYQDAPARLCEWLELENATTRVHSTLGGNTPQMHVNKVCKLLEAGELKMALLAGAEANYSLAQLNKKGIKSDWSPSQMPARQVGERAGTSDLENGYDLYILSTVYPIFETAFRRRLGHTPEAHARYVGELYASFAEVASQNPYAWQQNAYSAEEIYTPSPENRYIAYPYTKRMCANNQTDQAAALILTTQAMADELQVPQNQRVYPTGGADLQDVWDFACRPDLTRSEAIKWAGKAALEQANLTLEQIDAFDLYSCFPVAVQVARESLEILPEDRRKLTITGGLSYFGGAWNNYNMHAIVQAVENIRQKPQNILVTGLGWYITKHATGIYSSLPTGKRWNDAEKEARLAQYQQEIDSKALPAPLEKAEGTAEILGYTLVYERDGTPKRGIALCQVGEGRAWAFLEGEKSRLLALETEEWVGKRVNIAYHEARKRNIIAL